MSRIFLSHSSVDNASAVALRDWLVSEGWDDVFLDLDPEKGIVSGEQWKPALEAAIARCEAVLLLISADWLKSEPCRSEMEAAFAQGKRIFALAIAGLPVGEFPAALRETWQIVRLLAEEGGSAGSEGVLFSETGLTQLRTGLVRAGLDRRVFLWPPESEPDRPPWRGMLPMEAADAGIFFGREAPLADALELLRNLSRAPPPGIFAILGASGAGKSSFLRAGLLPRLARDDRHFLVLPPVRARHALQEGNQNGLVAALEEACRCRGIAITGDAIRAAKAEDRLAGLLSRLVALAQDTADAPPALVLPLDQAEELFGADAGAGAAEVLGLLRDLVLRSAPRLILIATIRSDDYPQLQSAVELEGLRQEIFSLPPLPRSQWSKVIEGPAARVRVAGKPLKLDPALTAALLTDAAADGGGDTLPLLALVLARLWEEHGRSGALSLADYEPMGGIGGVVNAAVVRAFRRADANSSIPAERAERMELARAGFIPWLAGVDPVSGAPHRHFARLTDIPEKARPLIECLVEERLLSREQHWQRDGEGRAYPSGDAVIAPVHEALLRQWTDLEAWIEEDAAVLMTLASLRSTAQAWQAQDRDPVWAVHRASRLEEASHLVVRPDLWQRLDATDHSYLQACRDAVTEDRERELHEARRRAALERSRRQILLVAGIIAFGLTVIAGIFWFTASVNERLALHNETAALGSLSQLALREAEPRDALLLALAAWPREGDDKRPQLPGTLDAIGAALPAFRLRAEVAPTGIQRFALAGSEVLATVDTDGVVRFWDTTTGTKSGVALPLPADPSIKLEFSDDGTRLLVVSPNARFARVLDTETRQQIGQDIPFEDGNSLARVTISPSGRHVLVGTRGSPTLWSVDEGRRVFALDGGIDFVAAEFSPDGSRLALGGWNGEVQIWSVENGSQIGPTGTHQPPGTSAQDYRQNGLSSTVRHLAFSRDGLLFASASDLGDVRIWNATDGSPSSDRLSQEAGLLGQAMAALAFSPDGSLLLSAGDDARMWSVPSGDEGFGLMTHGDGPGRYVVDAQFTTDGGRIYTLGASGEIRVWAGYSGLDLPVSIDESDVTAMRIASDDSFMVLLNRSGRLWLRDLDLGRPMLSLEPSPDFEVGAVSFSTDGSAIFAGGAGRELLQWRADSGAFVRALTLPAEMKDVSAITFAHTGLLAVATSAGHAVVMDTANGQADFPPRPLGSAVVWLGFSRDASVLMVLDIDGWLHEIDPVSGSDVVEPLRLVPERLPTAPAIAPEARRVAIANIDDGTIAVHDTATGGAQLLRQLLRAGQRDLPPLWGAFSPDGTRLMSWGSAETGAIWDVETGIELMRLRMEAEAVAFSPDGRHLVTVGQGHGGIWDISSAGSGNGVQVACSRIGGAASLDELTRRYGLGRLEPVCGATPPLVPLSGLRDLP